MALTEQAWEMLQKVHFVHKPAAENGIFLDRNYERQKTTLLGFCLSGARGCDPEPRAILVQMPRVVP